MDDLIIYTPEEVAAIVKIPERTVVRMCQQGKLPGARKTGRRWRIPKFALEEFYPRPNTP